MKFTVYERIMLGNLLPDLVPAQANRLIFASLNRLAEQLSLTEKEIKHIGLKQPGETFIDEDGKEIVVPEGQVMWRNIKSTDKDITIPESIRTIMVNKFKELDKTDKLPSSAIDIFDRFVKEDEWYQKDNPEEK